MRTRRRERLKRQHNTEWVAMMIKQCYYLFTLILPVIRGVVYCLLVILELALSHIHLSLFILLRTTVAGKIKAVSQQDRISS